MVPDTSNYKAIVCIFLYGGCQSLNWIVPYTQAKYNEYAAARGSLALSRASLIPMSGLASDGNQYAMRGDCPELAALWEAGHAAVICNVGTLVEPITKAEFLAGSKQIPTQLFSHIDQQRLWMTAIANSVASYGWGGRMVDLYLENSLTANLNHAVNVFSESPVFLDGLTSNQYVLGTDGAPTHEESGNTGYRSGSRASTSAALQSQALADSTNLFAQVYAQIRQDAASKVTMINSAFDAAGNVTTPFPAYLGDSDLGRQLAMVARVIKARNQIGDSRQIFFCGLGGFDHHAGEADGLGALMPILSKNIGSFYAALEELGVANNVTVFTNSDFGRTTTPNGDGSDHAWAGHAMVFGGRVQKGYYGTMPSLVVDGPDDVGRGRLIPKVSVDQYAASIAKWFGVQEPDLVTLFPNLANFTPQTYSFIQA